MKRHIRGRHRAAYLCALLAGLLLCLSGARADLLLFATAEDCETAELSGMAINAPHAVVLQKVNAAGEKKVRQLLKQAGVEAVEFLGLPGIKNRRYGSPWEVVWMPMPKMIRYISGEIIAATVIL